MDLATALRRSVLLATLGLAGLSVGCAAGEPTDELLPDATEEVGDDEATGTSADALDGCRGSVSAPRYYAAYTVSVTGTSCSTGQAVISLYKDGTFVSKRTIAVTKGKRWFTTLKDEECGIYREPTHFGTQSFTVKVTLNGGVRRSAATDLGVGGC